MTQIPFNRSHVTGQEVDYLRQVIESNHLAGDGPFTQRCSRWLEDRTGTAKALLTTSCTAALEMAVTLAGIQAGDEVIMPSFTFPSTAGAVARTGGTPVFVDIRKDTLNLDERLVRKAITPKTKALMPVHYAGVGCDLDQLRDIASEYGLSVIEDAAQGIGASYQGHHLGSIGQLGCLSFHGTKNIGCGEGGALLVNDPALSERAEVLRHNGTNRAQFFRGEVDRYTWTEVGSSYLPNEITAAFLWAQLEEIDRITCERLALWDAYHERLIDAESAGWLLRPHVPIGCKHNAHIYYLILPDSRQRDHLIDRLVENEITATFHYSPLHLSPAGRRFGKASGELTVTERTSSCLLRLPLWTDMTLEDIERVVDVVTSTPPTDQRLESSVSARP